MSPLDPSRPLVMNGGLSPRRSRRLRAAIAIVGAAVGAAGAPQVASAAPSPGFYDPPRQLQGAPGTVIRSEPMRLAVTPGAAQRFMCRSTDANGQPVAVTGTYIEPEVAYRGPGPRPLVAFAPGTQGQADGCAPSYGLERGYLSRVLGVTNFGYELPGIGAFVQRGVAVVVTDYVGLGTTDRLHTYVNRLDQGHAVLDAARAALQLPGATVTPASPVGAYGYSQGGAATGSAAELAPTYAPEVPLRAAYVGGPPADLAATLRQVDGTALTGVIGYAINGLVQTYPELASVVDELANDAGKRVLAKVAAQCEPDSMATFGFTRTSRWTTSGASVSALVQSSPVLKRIVDEQRIGRRAPQVPVLVQTATMDDIVPHAQAKQLAIDWCALDAAVTYQPIRQRFSSAGTGNNHVIPIFSAGPPARAWLLAQMAGGPSTANCASVAQLP